MASTTDILHTLFSPEFAVILQVFSLFVLQDKHLFICFDLPFTLTSGDTDAVLPVTSTRYSINALKLPTVTPWNAWYDDDGEVGSLL